MEGLFWPTYRRYPVRFQRGRGASLWDDKGRRYLDFFAGIGVASLGHGLHPAARAARRQISRLLHVSNFYSTEPMEKLARLLLSRFGPGRVFFCNSGTEANEAAIKLARKWGSSRGRREILAFENSFHGRTLGSLAATGELRYRRGFGPLPGGFRFARLNDLASVRRSISRKTCGVIVETIQGEGGVIPASAAFLRGLQALCRKRGALLIADEIQTGCGRTGRFFSYEHFGLRPDIATLAKGLASGLPIGCALARPNIAAALSPGDHGSTFGGNPVACAAAVAVLRTLRPAFLAAVRRKGELLGRLLREEILPCAPVKEVRGRGLMWGIVLDRSCAAAVDECRRKGLLVNCTAGTVIRLLPPLVVSVGEVRRAVEILRCVFYGLCHP